MRTCNKCSTEQPLENYGLCNKSKNRRGTCNSCRSAYNKQYKQKEGYREKQISNMRKYRYGISEEQYLKMLSKQDGKCAVCRKPESCKNTDGSVKNLSVDYDHKCCPDEKSSCGKCVRALLCAGCNRGIGYMKDDVSILLDAATYLMTFNNVLTGGVYYTDY